jgi:hypothetical protein
LQHLWATAVEIVDTFTLQSLKEKRGEEKWKRFFSLMSALIAIEEGSPPVPDTPQDVDELRNELARAEAACNVRFMLNSYHVIPHLADIDGDGKAYFYILILDTLRRKVTVKTFEQNKQKEAIEAYSEAETDSNLNVVMINSESLVEVKAAYQNYFADASEFLALLHRYLPSPIPPQA